MAPARRRAVVTGFRLPMQAQERAMSQPSAPHSTTQLAQTALKSSLRSRGNQRQETGASPQRRNTQIGTADAGRVDMVFRRSSRRLVWRWIARFTVDPDFRAALEDELVDGPPPCSSTVRTV